MVLPMLMPDFFKVRKRIKFNNIGKHYGKIKIFMHIRKINYNLDDLRLNLIKRI